MKKTLLKTMSIVTVAIMLMSVFTVGVTADNTEFFKGSTGIGLTVGEVNGNPFYTAFGADAMYSSADGENWLKRYTDSSTPLAGLDSVAYGNNIGIGVKSGEITAKYFTRDMNYDKNVYSYVEGTNGAEGYFIYLIPEIYYDSYSSLFFCHGFNAEAKDFDLYYSDGTLTEATYSGNTVNALTWTKTEGDFLDLHPWDWNGPADDQNFTLAWFKTRPFFITGNGNGYVIAPYGGNLNTRCAPVANGCTCGSADIRRCATVIKTTQNGEVKGGHLFTTAVMQPRAAAVTENGVIFLQPQLDKNQRLYYTDLTLTDLDSTPVISVICDHSGFLGYDGVSETTSAAFASENEVYFSKTATNQLYKFSVSKENNDLTITKEGNILEGSSYGVSDTSAWTVTDIETVSSEKAVMLINASNKAYIYEINLEAGALKALTADETYVSIDGSDANLTIAPNTYKPHGLQLQIGTDDPTTDKMIYEYEDLSGAKYCLDLDGIDVNGVFAWDDADYETVSFTLTAKSADYPSVMKTVEITATIGE